MKKFFALLILSFVITNCASQSVLMSDQQRDEFLEKNPHVLASLKDQQDPELRYKHYYVIQEAGKHWFIDCRGLHKDMKCWKSEATQEQVDRFGLKWTNNVDELAGSLAKCDQANLKVSERRDACAQFLSNSSSKNFKNEQIFSSLKTFCDLEAVECKLNKKKYGKGKFVAVPGKRMGTGSVSFTGSSTQPDQFYEFVYLIE